MDYEQELQ